MALSSLVSVLRMVHEHAAASSAIVTSLHHLCFIAFQMPPYKIKSSQFGWFHQEYQEDGSQAAVLMENLEGKLAARMALTIY